MTYETIENIYKSYNPQKDSKLKEHQEGYTVSELQDIHLTASNVIKTILRVYIVVKEHFEVLYQEEVLKKEKFLQLEIEEYEKKREDLTNKSLDNSIIKDLEEQVKELTFDLKERQEFINQSQNKRKWF